jgi:2'-5' RNA ligase
MGFAVELHIDPVSAAPIVALTEQIYTTCGGETLTGIGAHPHLSLTVFTQLDPTPLAALLAEFAATTAPLTVTFAAVGVFPTTQGVVYLAPVVTPELLALHARFHDRLTQLTMPSNAYYLPGNWMPHCTIGFELPPDKIGEAVMRCHQADVFRPVTLTTVQLIEFRPVRSIFTYDLQGA